MTTCIMSSLPGTAAAPATMGAPTALPPLAAKPRTPCLRAERFG